MWPRNGVAVRVPTPRDAACSQVIYLTSPNARVPAKDGHGARLQASVPGRRASPLATPSVPPVAAACRRPGANRPAAAPGRCASARYPRPQDLTGRPPRARRPVAAQEPSRCARALRAALRASLECDLPRQPPGACQEDESCGLARNGRGRCRLVRKRCCCPDGGATRTPEWTPQGSRWLNHFKGVRTCYMCGSFPSGTSCHCGFRMDVRLAHRLLTPDTRPRRTASAHYTWSAWVARFSEKRMIHHSPADLMMRHLVRHWRVLTTITIGPADERGPAAAAITESDRSLGCCAVSSRRIFTVGAWATAGRICAQMFQFWRRLATQMTHHQVAATTWAILTSAPDRENYLRSSGRWLRRAPDQPPLPPRLSRPAGCSARTKT